MRQFPALRGLGMVKDRRAGPRPRTGRPAAGAALAYLDTSDQGGTVCLRRASCTRGSGPCGRAGASVYLLVDDLAADLEGRSFEVGRVADGWLLSTRPAYASAIRAATDVGGQTLDLREFDLAVLAAIAYHQPVTRDGLKNIFGKAISRDLIGRLHARGLIGTGPRSPQRGAPFTFVTTEQFLVAFGLETLRDLPDREQLEDAGLSE